MEEIQKINIIQEVVYYIRNHRDYDNAATLLYNNQISLLLLAINTLRLSAEDIAKLGDKLLEIHNRR